MSFMSLLFVALRLKAFSVLFLTGNCRMCNCDILVQLNSKLFPEKQISKALLVEFDVHGQLLIPKRTMKENTLDNK